jgi:glycosyltransferase involved in cell wall biosynthesis
MRHWLTGNSVRHWGIGEIVPPGDGPALARAIRNALMPRRYTEASRAVEEARKNLSWERTAQMTIEAYRTVGLGASRTITP